MRLEGGPALATNGGPSTGSLRPGEASTPLATSTPHGRTRGDGVGDVVGVEPAGQDELPVQAGTPSARRPVEHLARTRRWRVDQEQDVGAVLVDAGRAPGSPAGKRLDDRPAPARRTAPGVLGRLVSAVQLGRPQPDGLARSRPPARGASSRNTPTVRISGGRRRTMSRATFGAICRATGRRSKPTASAPMATASRASSSLVMPQILTNTR